MNMPATQNDAGTRATVRHRTDTARSASVLAPTAATPEQVEIGRAILEIEAGIDATTARNLAAGMYREMIDARPAEPPLRFEGLTPGQAQAYAAIVALTEELGRYPTHGEVIAYRGHKSRAASLYMARKLKAAGYLRLTRRGRIKWIKPLG